MKSYAPSEKSGGGTGNEMNINSFFVTNPNKSWNAYGVMELDVSKISTLTIGSITTYNGPTLSGGYIRVRTKGGSSTIANLSVTNNPQTVDVSNYNEVELAIYFVSSTNNYANITMHNITGE